MLRKLKLSIYTLRVGVRHTSNWYVPIDRTFHDLSREYITHISRVREETSSEIVGRGISNIQNGLGFKLIKEGIKNIHYIPDGIRFLDLSRNPIKVIEGLPGTLRRLDMDHCNIDQITEGIIPNGVETLSIYGNYFSKIENIPSTVKHLFLGNIFITKLEGLPEGLLTFTFDSYNTIHKLENLPKSLIELYIPRQKISKIENLPHNLKRLSLYGNKIHILEMVPDSVEYLELINNPIEQIYHIPLNCTELVMDGRCRLNHSQIQYLRTHPKARRELIRQLKSGTGYYMR